MLSPKQIGTICFAIFSILISAPTFATGVSSSATSADCDNATLNTYTGTSNLQADWTANTIALHWYNDDTELTVPSASQSCTYDGTLTPPATIPTKTGYTFKGWRVRQAAPVTVAGLLSSVNVGTYGTSSTYSVGEWYYGESLGFEEVAVGEWSVTFPYGTVFGAAECRNSLGGTEYGESDQEYEVNAEEGDHLGLDYCYCRIYGFTPDGGTKQTDSFFEPVFAELIYPIWAEGPYTSNGCVGTCAYECAIKVETDSSFRTSLYAAH